MCLIKVGKINCPLMINPYVVLGLSKNATPSQTKQIFREKMLEARNNNNLRAKICLAYDIIVNKTMYIEFDKDIYTFNEKKFYKKICYYYAVIGDCLELIELIEENSNLLNYKDPLKRTLLYIAARNGHANICEYLINKGIMLNEIQSTGSTPLHGAAYYGQTNVVKLLINYGAKTNIKNNYGHLPIDEAMTDEIKNLLKESEKDPILKLYQTLMEDDRVKNIISIKKYGNIIAKKILCKLKNLPNKYNLEEVEKNWETAWHGTNFSCLESIVKMGLKPPGAKNEKGDEIKVVCSHITRGKVVNNIKDWANAIFVSPSIFYSGYEVYAKEIGSKEETWKVLVEVRVKPDSYFERESTCKLYKPKKNEPEMLEYRIPPENEKDVQVYSLTFIKKEFFENAISYEEGELFKNNK